MMRPAGGSRNLRSASRAARRLPCTQGGSVLSGSVWTPPAAMATLPPPDDAVPDPAYRRALERIYGFSAVPRSAAEQRADRPRKLPRVRALLERLGNPQAGYPSVLVAGTKGKGSTAAILAAILAAAGLR